jgi:hypothetical protein
VNPVNHIELFLEQLSAQADGVGEKLRITGPSILIQSVLAKRQEVLTFVHGGIGF